MGDIGVQLRPPFGVAEPAVFVEPRSALIAMTGAQVVLAATAAATIGQLAARHGDEGALGAFDDFEIADDEAVVKSDRTKGLEPFVVFIHELDTNFGDDHEDTPLSCGMSYGVFIPRPGKRRSASQAKSPLQSHGNQSSLGAWPRFAWNRPPTGTGQTACCRCQTLARRRDASRPACGHNRRFAVQAIQPPSEGDCA